MEAELLGVKKDNRKEVVQLKRADNGKIVSVPLDRLSDRDKTYVAYRRAADEPANLGALSITAICGRGCAKGKQACNVYVLSHEEYHAVGRTNEKLKPRGLTPLRLKDLEPGDYYVGVEAALDQGVIPTEADRFRPEWKAFFADDLPENAELVLGTDDTPVADGPMKGMFRVVLSLRKWYKVSVASHRVSALPALFLPRDESLADWEKYYPESDEFVIEGPNGLQAEFWDGVQKAAPDLNLTSENRERAIRLLTRGGRVCWPTDSVRLVMWLDAQGKPQARIAPP